MTRSRRSLLAALASGGVAIVAALGVLVIATYRTTSTSADMPPTAAIPTSTPTSLLAVGESVFRYGVGADGRPIARAVRGGGRMMGRGCAGCHSSDGRGRSTMMFTAPDITYANLTDPQGMLMPDGTRDVTYTDASLYRAVTTGIDPEGDHLEWPMPQWKLSGREWQGLLAYLRTLP
jgi:mono/diheme cytochrome c family protein